MSYKESLRERNRKLVQEISQKFGSLPKKVNGNSHVPLIQISCISYYTMNWQKQARRRSWKNALSKSFNQ